jgi:murein DD-endopeptidase MepM/ murein hydrolase activator NlpD
MRRITPLTAFLIVGLLGIATAATVVVLRLRPQEVVAEPFTPRDSHESYRDALTTLEIADSEMGTRWITAAARAEAQAIAVVPPVTEVITFDPRDPGAVGYRFPVTRGRQITVTISAGHGRYFADVFRLEEAGSNSDSAEWETAELVASRPDDRDRIVFEARSNNFYLLRLQPELLRGGRFTIEIAESESLAFPVEGTGPQDIWSFFGDGRDGGARVHHGIDVFAPRGTPVLAASESDVIRVGQRDRGGNVVVLRDDAREILLYYAHLDEQLVEAGTRVHAGDIIGTVGNTGNAITTPPHLHIGIYQGGWRRPVDPWPYFVAPSGALAAVHPPDPAWTGSWLVSDQPITLTDTLPAPARVDSRTARNRNPYLMGAGDTFVGAEAEPDDTNAPPPPRETVIDAGVPLRILGSFGAHLRVQSITGVKGLLSAADSIRYAARPGGPGGEVTLDADREVRDIVSGDTITDLVAGTTATRIAEVAGRPLVLLPSGDLALVDEEL